MLRLSSLGKDVDTTHIINKVIQDGTDGLLHSARGVNGAFILVPNDNTYAYMRFLAQNIFLIGAADKEGTNIVVVNAAKKGAIASSMVQALRGFGFHASLASGTWKGPIVSTTTIIDANAGQNAQSLALLQLLTHSTQTATPSAWTETNSSTAVMTLLEAQAKKSPKYPPHLVILVGADQTAVTTNEVVPTKKPSTTNSSSTTNKNTNSAVTNKNTNTATPIVNTNTSINTNTAPTDSNSNANTNTSTSNVNGSL
jgi:hypothetical protein